MKRSASVQSVFCSLVVLLFPIVLQLSCGELGVFEGIDEAGDANLIIPPPDFKVAFIGDSGYGPKADRVLKLIQEQGAQLVLHQGDLGYDESNPEAPAHWHSGVQRILDSTLEEGLFPYLFSVGNHDVRHWYQETPKGYARILEDRVDKTKNLKCTGELGVKSSCTYEGLFIILSGAGAMGEGHPEYLSKTLDEGKEFLWRIGSWHKNQHDMQVGGKRDEPGWEVYKHCQDAGAIIVTGHEHSYSRSFTLTDLGNESAGHGATGDPDLMVVGEGKTFVLVNGLGGKSGRDYHCEQHEDDTWWATIFARNYWLTNGKVMEKNCSILETNGKQYEQTVQEYNDGVLFITFNVGGKSHLAWGEFLTVEGDRIDGFWIMNERSSDAAQDLENWNDNASLEGREP